MKASLSALPFAALILAAWEPPQRPPTDGDRGVSVGGSPTKRFANYRRWVLVTPNPVDMAPAVAVSCIGPAEWDRNPTNPHFPRVFRVFVNSAGRAAMASEGKRPFPVGSIIVKEKYPASDVRPLRGADARWPIGRKLRAGAQPELLTAMIKRKPGFDPKNGDWEYAVLDGLATRIATKDLSYCGSCHVNRQKTDYVFGNYGQLTQ